VFVHDASRSRDKRVFHPRQTLKRSPTLAISDTHLDPDLQCLSVVQLHPPSWIGATMSGASSAPSFKANGLLSSSVSRPPGSSTPHGAKVNIYITQVIHPDDILAELQVQAINYTSWKTGPKCVVPSFLSTLRLKTFLKLAKQALQHFQPPVLMSPTPNQVRHSRRVVKWSTSPATQRRQLLASSETLRTCRSWENPPRIFLNGRGRPLLRKKRMSCSPHPR